MMLQEALRLSPVHQAWRSILDKEDYLGTPEGKVIVAMLLPSTSTAGQLYLSFSAYFDVTKKLLCDLGTAKQDFTCEDYTNWEPVYE